MGQQSKQVAAGTRGHEAGASVVSKEAALLDALTQLRDTVLWHLTRTGTSAADAGLLGAIEDADEAIAKADGSRS